MTNAYNRAKGITEDKVLRKHDSVRKAREAWTAAIRSHMAAWYGKPSQAYAACTPRSLLKKETDFFKVWSPWSSDTKEAYDKAIAAVGFSHDQFYGL